MVHLGISVTQPVRLGQGLVDGGAVNEAVVVDAGIEDSRLAGQVLGDLRQKRWSLVSKQHKSGILLKKNPMFSNLPHKLIVRIWAEYVYAVSLKLH